MKIIDEKKFHDKIVCSIIECLVCNLARDYDVCSLLEDPDYDTIKDVVNDYSTCSEGVFELDVNNIEKDLEDLTDYVYDYVRDHWEEYEYRFEGVIVRSLRQELIITPSKEWKND